MVWYRYLVTGASQLPFSIINLAFIMWHHYKVFPMIPGDIEVNNSLCSSTPLHQFSLSLPLHVLNNPPFSDQFPLSLLTPSTQSNGPTQRASQVIACCVILPFQPSIALRRPLSPPRKSTKAPVLQTARPNPISASIWLHYGSGFPL